MIIIPLYDLGNIKFNNLSKFFIKIKNKFLIEYCLESLDLTNNKLLFILSENDSFNHNIDHLLKKIYPFCMIEIINESYSVIDTIYKTLHKIENNESIIIYAPPFSYFEPKFDINKIKDDLFVLLVKTNNPIYCYANIKNNKIVNLREKQIVSHYGLIGLYYFKNKSLLEKYICDSKSIINIKSKKKTYLSDILNLLIIDGYEIGFEICDLVYPFTTNKNILYLKNKVLKDKSIFGLSCDHSGFKTKNLIKKYLKSKNISYIDYGCYTDNDCDFQDYITNQYCGYKNNEFNVGLSICRSGQGVNISSNHTGFYSALVYDIWSLEKSIEHNNCRFFCLSERLIEKKVITIEEIIETIFKSKFLGGRFIDRLIKVEGD